jgi:hypothetical protein
VQDLGEGFSAPAIAGDRLYIQGQQGGQQFVMAYDVHSGKQVWKTPVGRPFNEQHGNGPRSTPTVDGARLYALSADGTLACLENTTGKRVWELNLIERFGGRGTKSGYTESPLVDGDRLIVMPGGPGAAVVALYKSTGEPLWKSQSDAPGYSSAIAFDIGGTHALALLTAGAAIGLDAKDGAPLWRYTRVANKTANIATPIAHDGYVFYSTDYGTGCVLLRPTPDGKTAEVYFNRDMRNHYTTSVLVGDYLYGFSSEILTAMEFKTGKVAWRNRSVGKGNCIYAEQHLYCMGEDGAVGLIDATPSAYNRDIAVRDPARRLQHVDRAGHRQRPALPAGAEQSLLLQHQEVTECAGRSYETCRPLVSRGFRLPDAGFRHRRRLAHVGWHAGPQHGFLHAGNPYFLGHRE